MKSYASSPPRKNGESGGRHSLHPEGASTTKRPAIQNRFAVRLAGWFMLAALSGCAMCQNPWDYCNAVIGPGGCPNCNFGARRGSVFVPIGHTPPATELGPTPAGATSEPAEPDESYSPEPSLDGLELFDDSATPTL